jgi:phosphate-selective porin OprO/OprP
MNRKFFSVTLSAFMLMYLILFSTPDFAEEAKIDIVASTEVSRRRRPPAISPAPAAAPAVSPASAASAISPASAAASAVSPAPAAAHSPSPAPSSVSPPLPSSPYSSLPPDHYGDQLGKRGKNVRLKIGQVNPEIELGISLLWDYDYFNGANVNSTQKGNKWCSASELRKASIALKSKLNRYWQAKLKVSFNDEGDTASEIDDAYIKFTGWSDASLTIGKAKEPFGLEELTSSEDVTTIERSMATHAFAPGRNPGLGLSGDISHLTWAIGVYKAMDRNDKGDTYALTSRLTFVPWQHKRNLVHLGVAGSVRDYGGEKYGIEDHAEVHAAEKIVTSVKTLADKVSLLGFEAAWVNGPFSLQAEYMTASMQADIGHDATYAGYYFQGSYFLTGESRQYKKGAFDKIKPGARYGALELVSRYSVLDAEDNNAEDDNTDQDPHNSAGVKAANLTFGVNYYISEQVRLAANYIKTRLTGGIKDDRDSANAISFRAQYSL